MATLGAILVGLVMLAGLAGTVVPLLPGLLIIWGAGMIHAAAHGFDAPTWVLAVVLSVLAAGGQVASLVLPHRGAAASGASGRGLVGGVAGAVIGMVVLPVLGLPIGAVAGIYLAERARTGDPSAAWRATKGALRGVGIGAIVEATAGVLMIAAWLSWLLFA